MSSAPIPEAVISYLTSKGVSYEYVPQYNKIRLLLTGTEIKASNLKEIKLFVEGRVYNKASRVAELNKSCSPGEDKFSFPIEIFADALFVPHKDNAKKVYCKLTKTVLNKDKHEIEKHINGKSYQTQLKQKKDKEEKRRLKEESEAKKRNASGTGKDEDILSRMQADFGAEEVLSGEEGEEMEDDEDNELYIKGHPYIPGEEDEEEQDDDEEEDEEEEEEEEEDEAEEKEGAAEVDDDAYVFEEEKEEEHEEEIPQPKKKVKFSSTSKDAGKKHAEKEIKTKEPSLPTGSTNKRKAK